MVIALNPGAAAATQNHGPHSRSQKRNSHHLAIGGAAICAGVGIATLSLSSKRSQAKSKTLLHRKPKLSNLGVDAICGAVGEIAALVALYPLDTIKVHCQATSSTAGTVIQNLARLPTNEAIRSLYAGVGPAAVGAGVVGSLYLVAFYAAKRIGHKLAARENLANSDGLIASAAGVAASLLGSLVDSPIEHFKVRTQAGAGDGPMHLSLFRAATQQGFGNLYYSLLPFLLKSIPHDVAELVTFSAFHDMRANSKQLEDSLTLDSSSNIRSKQPLVWQQQLGNALAGMPVSLGDMLIGAAAGAAAAAASMPCDVIFTQMNLNSACMVAAKHSGKPSLTESASLFLRTGQQLVRRGGYKALFYGFAPRLMQTVPAGIVYWLAVETTRRGLQQRFDIVGNGNESVDVAVAVEKCDSSSCSLEPAAAAVVARA